MLGKKIREKLVGRELDDSAFRAQTHYEIGMKLSEKGRHDQALAEFNKATKLHPEFAEAHVELGSTYLSLGRLDKAIEAYTEALRIRPDCVEAYGNLGLAYDRSGNFVRALAMYMKAIRYRPSDVELRRNLGLAYFNIGSYSEAIKAYQRAIQISPTDGQAHYYLGLVHLDLEDKESAMEEQKKLKELGHDDLAYLLLDEIDRQTWRVARGRDRVDGVEISNRHSGPAEIMRKSDDQGFSALELLIVVAMVLVISGFAVLNYVQGGRAVSRTNAAVELANQLQKARNDSMRHRPTDVDQMAQAKVLNRRSSLI
jgi:prepilin-type N-terminal cleavage/methylation domain-containing protein